MKCIRIGYGKIARIHEQAFSQMNVQTSGVLESDPLRIEEIKQAGMTPLHALEDAIALHPDFFDICTPTHAHAQVLQTISILNPYANILIEKPICDFEDLDLVTAVLNRHKGHIVVNENYCSSTITQAVKDKVLSLALRPTRIIIEMTKHRGQDYLKGRFIDHTLGALGYEGSHLLALVGEFGEDYANGEILETDIDSIALTPEGAEMNTYPRACEASAHKSVSLSHQGGAFMKYIATNGCIVELYTSMSGIIGYPCPPFAYPEQHIPQQDESTRYRILRIDGVDSHSTPYQIIGFFEPITDLPRRQGCLLVFRDWVLAHRVSAIEDDTMTQHLSRALQCFSNTGPNPYSVQRAMQDVTKLHDWARSGWFDMEDSDEVLGSDAVSAARIDESRQFKMV